MHIDKHQDAISKKSPSLQCSSTNKFVPLKKRYNLRQRRQPQQYQVQHLSSTTNFKALAARYIQHKEYVQQQLQHIYDVNGKRQSIDKLLNGKDGKTKWNPALSNEWGRLAQGNDNGVEYTNTIEFIAYKDVPLNRKVTYTSFVCDYRPLKKEKWRIRLVVGGDKLDYNFDSGSPATDLT